MPDQTVIACEGKDPQWWGKVPATITPQQSVSYVNRKINGIEWGGTMVADKLINRCFAEQLILSPEVSDG